MPCPAPTVIAAAKEEVAEEVEMSAPTVASCAKTFLPKKELVLVALVSVALVAVMFANAVAAVKVFVPEKVLLLATF